CACIAVNNPVCINSSLVAILRLMGLADRYCNCSVSSVRSTDSSELLAASSIFSSVRSSFPGGVTICEYTSMLMKQKITIQKLRKVFFILFKMCIAMNLQGCILKAAYIPKKYQNENHQTLHQYQM